MKNYKFNFSVSFSRKALNLSRNDRCQAIISFACEVIMDPPPLVPPVCVTTRGRAACELSIFIISQAFLYDMCICLAAWLIDPVSFIRSNSSTGPGPKNRSHHSSLYYRNYSLRPGYHFAKKKSNGYIGAKMA